MACSAGSMVHGIFSNGISPFHSCSPVQPGTGSQPLERGRTGTLARTRLPMRPVGVGGDEVVIHQAPVARRRRKARRPSARRSIGSVQSNDVSGSANCIERSTSAGARAGSPAMTGPCMVSTTSMVDIVSAAHRNGFRAVLDRLPAALKLVFSTRRRRSARYRDRGCRQRRG